MADLLLRTVNFGAYAGATFGLIDWGTALLDSNFTLPYEGFDQVLGSPFITCPANRTLEGFLVGIEDIFLQRFEDDEGGEPGAPINWTVLENPCDRSGNYFPVIMGVPFWNRTAFFAPLFTSGTVSVSESQTGLFGIGDSESSYSYDYSSTQFPPQESALGASLLAVGGLLFFLLFVGFAMRSTGPRVGCEVVVDVPLYLAIAASLYRGAEGLFMAQKKPLVTSAVYDGFVGVYPMPRSFVGQTTPWPVTHAIMLAVGASGVWLIIVQLGFRFVLRRAVRGASDGASAAANAQQVALEIAALAPRS